MEEAAQILEVETFIPMTLQQQKEGDGIDAAVGKLKRVVLIGDHHQLPPVIKNKHFQRHCKLDQRLREGKEEGLGGRSVCCLVFDFDPLFPFLFLVCSQGWFDWVCPTSNWMRKVVLVPLLPSCTAGDTSTFFFFFFFF